MLKFVIWAGFFFILFSAFCTIPIFFSAPPSKSSIKKTFFNKELKLFKQAKHIFLLDLIRSKFISFFQRQNKNVANQNIFELFSLLFVLQRFSIKPFFCSAKTSTTKKVQSFSEDFFANVICIASEDNGILNN